MFVFGFVRYVRVCSVCSAMFAPSFVRSVESVRFIVDPPLAARPCYASEVSVAA